MLRVLKNNVRAGEAPGASLIGAVRGAVPVGTFQRGVAFTVVYPYPWVDQGAVRVMTVRGAVWVGDADTVGALGSAHFANMLTC